MRVAAADNIRNREIYNQLKADPRYKGATSITPGHLRELSEIKNQKGTHEFSFSDRKGDKLPIEILLDRNDILHATAIGMHLVAVTQDEEGRSIRCTYPNPAVFPTATVGGNTFTREHLEVFYNGVVKQLADQAEYFNSFDTQSFRKVPNRYAGEFLGVNTGTTPANEARLLDEAEFGDGIIGIEPHLLVSGNINNRIQVEVPMFDGIQVASVTTGVKHYVMLSLYGFLIKGVNKG